VQLDFPPGAVGLHLAIIGTEAPYAKEVKPYCPLRNFLIGGEILLSINATEVADKHWMRLNKCLPSYTKE
jgi:hypothetical protein